MRALYFSKWAGNACVTDDKRWWLTPVENFVNLEKTVVINDRREVSFDLIISLDREFCQ